MPLVSIVQRFCPHYRIPIFRELAAKKSIDLSVFFGKDTESDNLINAKDISGFNYKKLFTIPINITRGIKHYPLGIYPSLLYHLIKGKYDIIISGGGANILNNFLVITYCKIKGAKFIWWGTGLKDKKGIGVFERIVLFVIRFMLKKSDACISYSSRAKKFFISMGVPEEKIFIAQNSIDERPKKANILKYEPQLAQYRQNLGLNDKKIILYVGSIEKRKKIENLILAFKDIVEEHPEVLLYIVGDGYYRKELFTWYQKEKVPNVQFLGRLSDEITMYFLLSNVVVLPSHGGLAINESMIHGKPIVCSVADGTEEDLIINGENGFVVDNDNLDQLRSAICKILFHDGLGEKMGKKSKELVETKFNINNMLTGFEKAITYVLNN